MFLSEAIYAEHFQHEFDTIDLLFEFARKLGDL